MTLLTIETSTNICSAAWCVDGECVAERIHTGGSNHAALLPQFIEALLQEAQVHGWKADAVAVSAGPGSYTGLRIGVSTAKGLCYGWNIPMIAVPTLDILVQAALEQHPEINGTLVPMLDARRMEVYTSFYRPIASSPAFAQVVNNADWLPQDTEVYYFGDGAAKCQTILESTTCHIIKDIFPRAAVMGKCIVQHHYPLIGEKDLAYYTPFYLKEFIAAPSHIKGLK